MRESQWVTLEETTSTNQYLREEIEAGRLSTAAVWAKRQTAGRGRRGREWLSPEGGIYLSLSVSPGDAPPFLFGMAAGIAAVALLQERGFAVGLKWPNDLLVRLETEGKRREHKLGGLLSQLFHVDDTPYVVVGLGLNVNTSVTLEEGTNALPPASLQQATTEKQDVETLVQLLVPRIWGTFQALLDTETPMEARQQELHVAWMRETWTLGRRVRIQLPQEKHLEGVAVGITTSLALLVQDAAGTIHEVQAGDCIHLRDTA